MYEYIRWSPIQEAISESIKALMPTASAKEFSVFMKVLFGMSKFKDGETVRESARECGGGVRERV